jgi:CBS domain containing-hemolysin-like protein
VVTLPADRALPEIRDTVLEAGHTRYPVVADADADRVVGFVDVKDVLRAGEAGDETATAADLARDLIVVPETTAVGDLLVQFREEHRQMAAVVDEWGAFEGIVTVEDVAESLVGDLRDEFDTDRGEHTIRAGESGGYEADGSVSLSDVNDALGTDLERNSYETLGGLVLDRLGRTAEAGDAVEADGYRFQVTAVDGARISTVRIEPIDDGDAAADGDDETADE